MKDKKVQIVKKNLIIILIILFNIIHSFAQQPQITQPTNLLITNYKQYTCDQSTQPPCWGQIPIGSCTAQISAKGCLLTNFAIILNYAGAKGVGQYANVAVNPGNLDDWLTNQTNPNGYSNGCDLMPYTINIYPNGYVKYDNSYPLLLGTAFYNILRTQIQGGDPVIVNLQHTDVKTVTTIPLPPKTPTITTTTTTNTHFVLAYGYYNNGTKSTDFIISDPGSTFPIPTIPVNVHYINNVLSQYDQGIKSTTTPAHSGTTTIVTTTVKKYKVTGYRITNLTKYALSGFIKEKECLLDNITTIKFSNGISSTITDLEYENYHVGFKTGIYKQFVPHNYKGTITPLPNGYSFVPTYRSFNNIPVINDLSEQNFNATSIPFNIRGKITITGNVFLSQNISLHFQNDDNSKEYDVSTDMNKEYLGKVNHFWSGKVYPKKLNNYAFYTTAEYDINNSFVSEGSYYQCSNVLSNLNGLDFSAEKIFNANFKANNAFSKLPVEFIDMTTAISGYKITQWKWDFGYGNTSTLQKPPPQIFEKNGIYPIKLTVSDGINTNTIIKNISIISPIIDFYANNDEVSSKITVYVGSTVFFHLKTKPSNFLKIWTLWSHNSTQNFASNYYYQDGYDQVMSIKYDDVGTYTVQLTGSVKEYDSQKMFSKLKSGYINVIPMPPCSNCSVSGKLRNSSNTVGYKNVLVRLKKLVKGVEVVKSHCLTDGYGKYTLYDVQQGDFIEPSIDVPTLSDWNPESRPYPYISSSQTNQDFILGVSNPIGEYILSGKITDAGSNGIPGVTINIQDYFYPKNKYSITTSSDGTYSKTLPGNSYYEIITECKNACWQYNSNWYHFHTEYIDSPIEYIINMNSDIPDVNFIGDNCYYSKKNSGSQISGVVKYNDNDYTGMCNTKVYLYNLNGDKINSVTTDNEGKYLLTEVENGNYVLKSTTTDKWGGCNPIDAMLVSKHFIGKYPITDSLILRSADVNNDNRINPTDVLLINKRFVGSINRFARPDFIFEEPIVNILGTNVTQDIKAICTGDIDRSGLSENHCLVQAISSLQRFSKNINSSTDSLNAVDGIVSIDSITAKPWDTVKFAINMHDTTHIGAFGFRIKYDTTALAFDTIINININTQDLIYKLIKDSLNIAWSSLNGAGFSDNSVKLCDLRFIYKGGHTELTFLDECMVGDINNKQLNISYFNGYVGQLYIDAQAQNAIRCLNDSVTFNINAIGDSTLWYQWYHNNEQLTISNEQLILNNISKEDEGEYYCVVSNIYGRISSDIVTLTVDSLPPSIIQQPTGGMQCAGTSFNFNITANSESPLIYNWIKNDSILVTSIDSSNTIQYVNNSDAGIYRCIVSNACGSVSSDKVSLNVPSPKIIEEPSNISTCEGRSVRFYVKANSNDSASYQWYKRINDEENIINNAIQDSLVIDSVSISDTGAYFCVISNSYCSVTSMAGSLNLSISPPIITLQPISSQQCSGRYFTFKINASESGTENLAFQWYKNDTIIPYALDSTYYIYRTDTMYTGTYKCKVSNSCGSVTSNSASLNIHKTPVILQESWYGNKCTGSDNSFSVRVKSRDSLIYQWYKNDTLLIPGANKDTFKIISIIPNDAGIYKCNISNSICSINSVNAVLNVSSNVPEITKQPISGQQCFGKDFTIKIKASSTDTVPLSFQWYKENYIIPFANDSTYYEAFTDSTNAGNFKCVVTNGCGSVTSENALLISINPIEITEQQIGDKKCIGDSINFKLNVKGTPPFNYQWFRNDTLLIGDSLSTLTRVSVSNADAGIYKCIVKNSCETLQSEGGLLTINNPLEIIRQPQLVSLCAENDFAFSISSKYGNSAPSNYKWYKNDTIIPFTNDSILNIYHVWNTDIGNYKCVLTNACGSITSEAASMTVNTRPSIIIQPKDSTQCAGNSVILNIVTNVTNPCSYQWYKFEGGDWNIEDGETNDQLTINNCQLTDASFYKCEVSNVCGNITSNMARIHINLQPSITQEPQSVISCQSSDVSFEIAVDSNQSSVVSYQWKKIVNNESLIVDRATQSKYTIKDIGLEDEGEYYCVVTNECGSVTSDIATLTSYYNNQGFNQEAYIDSTAVIDITAIIGEGNIINSNTTIGAHTRTGQNVYLGASCVIGANVIIGNDVQINDSLTIGDNVKIKDGTAIGFSIGNCIDNQNILSLTNTSTSIGSNVKIGCKSNIGAGINIADNCILGSNVKIADGTSVGLKAIIGNFVHVNNGAIISDTVKIADGSYIGNGVNIHSKAQIGINAIIRDSATLNEGIKIADKGIILKNAVANDTTLQTITEPFNIVNEYEFARDNAKIYGNFLNGFSLDTITLMQADTNMQLLNTLTSISGMRINSAMTLKNGFRVNDKITFSADNTTDTYLWDFGDCTSSSETDPEHRYTKPGIYVIKLTQTSESSCIFEKQFTGAITIYPVDKAKFKQEEGAICNEEHEAIFKKEHKLSNMRDASCYKNDSLFKSYERMDSSFFRIAYQWSYDAQNMSQTNQNILAQQQMNIQQPDTTELNEYLTAAQIKAGLDTIKTRKSFDSEGEHFVQLNSTTQVQDLITGEWAYTASMYYYTDTITVAPVFKADFKIPESSCIQDTVSFTDNSKHCSPVSYYWNLGNDSISTVQNPKMLYAEAGDYDILLAVTDTSGTTDTIVKTIYIGNYCDITGTLIASVNCNSTPAAHDTLVLKNGSESRLEAITDDSGHFAFNVRKLRDIDNDSLKYMIDLKRGVGVDDTNKRTISEWLSESPLNLRLKKVVQEWIVKYGNVDTSGVATAVDLMDNIYVTGTSTVSSQQQILQLLNRATNNYLSSGLRINSTQIPTINNIISTIKYGPDGKKKWITNYMDEEVDCYSSQMKIDNNNNIYVTGYTINNTGLSKYILIKYDSTGNLKWSTNYILDNNYMGQPNSLEIDNSDNVYINGWAGTGSSNDFTLCGSLNFQNVYFNTIKYNSQGVQQWIRRFGDNDNLETSFDCRMRIDSNANVYVAGCLHSCENNVPNVYLSIKKYNTEGTQQWAQTFTVEDTLISTNYGDMKIDADGKIYITGEKKSNDFSGHKYFITKYNPNGNQEWIKPFENALPISISLCNSGDIYVSGLYPNNNSTVDYSIVKYGNNGEQLWYDNNSISGQALNNISTDVDNNDNLYFATVLKDDTINNYYKYLIKKYSDSGSLLWEESSVKTEQAEYGYRGPLGGLVVSPNNNFYLAMTDSYFDTISSTNYSQFKTIKYSQCPETAHMLKHMSNDNTTSKAIKQENASVKLYPNPNDGTFSIELQIPYDGNVVIEAYNIIGSKVMSEIRYMNKGENKLNLRIDNAKNGLYFINIRTEREVFNRKMVVR